MSAGGHTLLLELFAIFVWAKVFGELFEHLALPAVLGEILAGVVIGPYASRLVVPGELTFTLAELGAVFLLFSVGLETKPQDLLSVGRESLLVAISGVVVPFLLGFTYMMQAHHRVPESMFVAAAMVATSVGITARVLADMGVLNSRAARITLGAAVFDDILGMLILAVVTGMASAGRIRWIHLGTVAAEALLFVVVMLFLAPRLIRRIRPRLEMFSMHNAPLALALALCLGISVAADKIGMAAIIGAFFAGLAFAEYAPEWNLQPSVHGTAEFLAPFFFFAIGARLDLRSLTPDVVVAAIIVTLLAVLSKLVGCGAVVLNAGRATALQVGVGMVPRGEVGLIIALVGLEMGVISQKSYAIVVFMAAATTLFAPPVLRLVFRPERHLDEQKARGAPLERPLRRLVVTLFGIGVSAALAVLASVVFSDRPQRVYVPLFFIGVAAVTSFLWGRVSGVVGALASALVFMFLLFRPLGTWTVSEEAARANLGWMLLGSAGIAYLAPTLRDKTRGLAQSARENP